MATTKIEGVYEIKIEQGPALRAFEEVKKRLDNTKASIRDLNKVNKELIAAEQQITKAIREEGVATEAQAKQLASVQAARNKVNRELSEAVLIEKGLSAQSRELSNDLSGLTANGLRFRDKMADANLEALKGSGILGQLAAQERSLKVELEGVNQKLQSGTITQEQYDRELKKINASVDGVKSKSVQLEAELTKLNEDFRQGAISQKQYQDGLRNIEQQTAGLSQKFDSFVSGQGAQLKSTLSSLATSYIGVGAAIYGLQNLVGDAITTVVDFNKALSGIKALGGEYAANIDRISEAAKTAGINFGFTATQSLDAVEALAKAGVSTADILGGGLTGALTLAAAGEISVGEAAETAAKAMTQFGLAGEDIPHLADLLAAAAATATGDVGDFNQALNQAGLVASQLNIPIEEAIGTLTAFASAGLLGSDAGTSFRTMLLRLQNPTKESAELLQKYNIDAFDLQGNFVGIESLAGQLQERLGGLTQEQRSAALAQIFGSDAIRAANVLYTQGADGVAKFTEQVNQSGFAAQVAADKTDNLTGDLDRLKANYDALILSVEDGNGVISNAFRGFIQGATEALGLVQQFNKESGQKNTFLQDIQAATGGKLDRGGFGDNGFNVAANNLDQIKSLVGIERELDTIAKKYQQVIASVQNNTDAEQRLSLATTVRAQSLDRVKSLQEKIASEGTSRSLEIELGAAKASVIASQRIIDATRDEVKAKGEVTGATKEATAATEADTKAKADNITKTLNAAGSVADLQDQISKLQTQQSQSTSSAQFATYESQIKTLSEEVDILTGKLTREFLDAANAIPERIAPRNPEPQIVSGADKLNTELLGLNPNAPELVGKSLAEVQDLLDAAALNRLQESANLNDQLLALEIQWKDGSIKTYQEYADARAKIEADISEKARASQEADLQSVSNGLAAVQSLVDASFDGKLQRLDQQNADLNDKLRQATTDEQKELIKRDIERTAQEKKQLQARKEAAKGFGVIAALINTYQAANAAFVSQLVPGDPSSLPRATAAAVYATIAGLLNVAKLQGLAEGGEVGASGTVTPAWGQRVNRGNGDNVLVSTRKGYVTLRTGEKVLNDQQQQRLESIAGPSVWGAIGLPGHGTAKHYLNQAYAEGGTIGIVTPRPSPSSIVSSQVAATMADFIDRPTYVDIHEVRSVNSRVEVTEQARTI